MHTKTLSLVYLFIFISNISFSSNFYGVPGKVRDFISHPDDDELTYVVLVGDAIEKVNSDIAIVDVLITTEGSKLSEAMNNNNTVKDEFINKLINNEIKRDNIKQSKFSTSPQTGWFGIESIEVINRASITIKNANLLNIIASLVDEYDEINIIDISFKHSEKDKYKAMIKEKAIEDAIIKKETYEKLLDVKLDIVSFYDTSLDKRFKNTTDRRNPDSTIEDISSRALYKSHNPFANASSKRRTSKASKNSFSYKKSSKNIQNNDKDMITDIYLPSFEEIEYKDAVELLCKVNYNK